ITILDQLVEASKGVDVFFHVAAVFGFHVKDPENDLIKPTVEGALNALRATKENNIPKIILTSSIIALGNSGTKENPMDENSWNTDSKIPYSIAKYRSEWQAWEYANENKLNLVVINPGMIIGGEFHKITPSLKVFLEILENKIPAIPPLTFNPVDVTDLAKAHIIVSEKDDANGRYICATRPYSFSELIEISKKFNSNVKVPKVKISRFIFRVYTRISYTFFKLLGKTPQLSPNQAKEYTEGEDYVDTSRILNLGWKPTDIETSIENTINWITKQEFTLKKQQLF
ncbi:MAG: NAD-dependent epimerase/dehydratase family protein, partial [Candidatus Heimdallarchaeota archaeon]|nr:NAD-dependent epimerase/dehydratase family protein [Candidatus Heimdallarchaeota archaeon]